MLLSSHDVIDNNINNNDRDGNHGGHGGGGNGIAMIKKKDWE